MLLRITYEFFFFKDTYEFNFLNIHLLFSGALVNAVFLVALCFSITIESAKRFYEPEEIHNPKMILIVGALGLVVNLLGLCLFHEHGGGHGHSHGGHGHGHSHGGHGTHSHLAGKKTKIVSLGAKKFF